MSERVYVGHLSSSTSQRDLEDIFAKYGKIVKIDTKHSFAFIVGSFFLILSENSAGIRRYKRR
jgi:hypothetical protein